MRFIRLLRLISLCCVRKVSVNTGTKIGTVCCYPCCWRERERSRNKKRKNRGFLREAQKEKRLWRGKVGQQPSQLILKAMTTGFCVFRPKNNTLGQKQHHRAIIYSAMQKVLFVVILVSARVYLRYYLKRDCRKHIYDVNGLNGNLDFVIILEIQ